MIFFLIWTGSETQLKQFHEFINANSCHLKFTMEYDKRRMNFLDILVYRELNRLGSNLYQKSTDRNSILHGHSFHPIPLKRSLPLSQFSRIRRICSSDSDFKAQAADLEKCFQQRQYKHDWITIARNGFKNISLTDCLRKIRSRTSESRVNCIVQYSPLGRDFESIIKKHWHIIDSDPALKCFTTSPRIVFKRAPNLKNMLVRAHFPLHHIFCSLFPLGITDVVIALNATSHIKLPPSITHVPENVYDIKGVITCNTKNVIYLLKCPCGLAYVGKTTRPLKRRISEHRSNIRNHDI